MFYFITEAHCQYISKNISQQRQIQMQKQQLPLEPPDQFQSQFSLPALELPHKHYSLQADIATGWQPNKMKVVGPVPLNFDAAIVDQVVENLTQFGKKHTQRVVYLGHRYVSSFKMHQEMRRQYNYKHEAIINTNFPHLAAYFRKFYSHFKPKHNRPFKGMNPTLKPGDSVVFDAGFQSANLDAAIKVGPHEYDIFMRVDSNTRGHLQWYNFTVKGSGVKKIKINIVNCRRGRTLYNYSLRPYFWSSVSRGMWKQGGNNVKYEEKQLRYNALKDFFNEEKLIYNCLSFEYQFQNEDQIVQFAYGPPFTYSDNAKMIQNLLKVTDQYSQNILKEDSAGQSLAGLDIPILTITDPQVPDAFKTCIFISARIHPGQTCGSYMVKGFLQFIVSKQQVACQLRKQIIFKVIPMANPDGVTVGNFRTSLCGRDLNRMFRREETMLIPEVMAIKNTVKKLKNQFKNRLQFFLDFHGHSVRKNVFIYGPQYEIWQTNYYRTRILPKLISDRTEMFRYYSCMFRIAPEKKTTARAVLLKHIPHCYTVEASVGMYYSPQEKKDYEFTPQSWQLMGKYVGLGLGDYFKLIDNSKKNMSKGKSKGKVDKKEGSLPKVKISGSKTRKKFTQNKDNLEETRRNNIDRLQDIEKQLFEMNDDGAFLEDAKGIIDDIKQADKQLKINQQKYSEGGSDSEPDDDDLSEKQMSSLHHHIILSLKEFKQRFYNKGQVKPARHSLQSSVQLPHKKLEMIASLRKKAEQVNQTRGEISTERMVNASGHTNLWVRGRTSRRASGIPVAESQSFHIYVNKLKVVKDEVEQCRQSYFSPRKRGPLG